MLADAVAELVPEAENVSPNSYLGDFPVSLRWNRGQNTYTFTRAGGDCPSGCIFRRLWTFRVENDQAVLVSSEGSIPSVTWERYVTADVRIRAAEGSRVHLINHYPSDVFSYQWYHNGVPIEPSDVDLLLDSVSPDEGGVYHCVTTDAIAGSQVQGKPFVIEIMPENYLWRLEETTVSVSWDGYSFLSWTHPVFGYVNPSRDPWISIHGFGEVYAFGSMDGPIWLYDSELGWLYTSALIAPYYYAYPDATWIWYDRNYWDGANRRLYNFSTASWQFKRYARLL